MSQEAAWPGAFKLCLVYAPADRKLYEKLETYLKILERRRLIEFWCAQDIPAGSERAEVLMDRLASADLCVYLLSPDLLGSEYYLQARPELLAERYRLGEVRIVPVVLRPLALDWLDPPFNELELLPTEKRPVTRWRDRDAALLNVVMGVERVIANMGGQANVLALGSGDASSETIDTPFWYVPYRRNMYFTGHDELLTALHERFSGPRDGWPAIQALTGLGGVGKT